jgi:hypothetical protein
MRICAVASALACILVVPLAAQDTTELLNRIRAMEERIKTLEAEVQALKTAPSAAPAPQPAVAPAQEQVPATERLGGAGGASAKLLNPNISVIGDFLGAVGNSAGRSTPALEMHETEVGLQEVIDPYARADFFLSFGHSGVELEEGYITFTSLPGGLQVKAGKMRAAFGKVNTMHNHMLPWTDRPLVTQNLVSGEEGISDAGLSLSRILPAPKGIFLEGTAQLYRGDSENLFQSVKRSDLAAVARLRAYRDITESTNLDLGGSFARGRSLYSNGWNQLYGFDATLRWKPLSRSIYRSFVGRAEFAWARTVLASPPVITPFGFYVSGDYQLRRRWFLGGRFDRAERGMCPPSESEAVVLCDDFLQEAPGTRRLWRDTGGSFLLTYWPSEFSQIRGQFRRTRYGEGLTANEFLFQFLFSIGAHGAHPF